MSADTPRSVRDRGSDCKCARYQGRVLAPVLLRCGQTDQGLRVRAPREGRTKGCHFGHEWAATAHGEKRGSLEAAGAFGAPASNRRTVRCCTHAVAAETSPGARAEYRWVKGCAAGTDRWPNSSLGQLRHQRLASTGFSPRFARSEGGRIRGGNSCDRAEASSMRTRVSQARPPLDRSAPLAL